MCSMTDVDSLLFCRPFIKLEFTSYNRLGASGGEEVAKELQSLADSTAFTAQQAEVQNNVHQQISAVAELLDQVLLIKSAKDEEPLKKSRPSGLSFAVGHAPPKVVRYAYSSGCFSKLFANVQGKQKSSQGRR